MLLQPEAKNDLTFRLYQRKENESSEEDRVSRSFGNGGVNSGKSSLRLCYRKGSGSGFHLI
jgi:hypothetical protein